MRCPECGCVDSKVIDSRPVENHTAIRRRRECSGCGSRFTTYERIANPNILFVVKRDGRIENFDREKILKGILKACEKLSISPDVIEKAVSDIEERIRSLGVREIESKLIGEYVMEELKKINQVAYVRFASVYRAFTDVESFIKEISKLMEERGK